MSDNREAEVSVHVATQPETVFPPSPTLAVMSHGWARARNWNRYPVAATAS